MKIGGEGAAARGQAIRRAAENNLSQLEHTPEGWTEDIPSHTDSYDGQTVDFHYIKGPQGQRLSGYQGMRGGHRERFKVDDGSTEYSMRVTPHPSVLAEAGEKLNDVGFGVAMKHPLGSLLGVPLMLTGQFLSASHLRGPDTVYQQRDIKTGQTEYAVFDSKGRYTGNQPASFQRHRFE